MPRSASRIPSEERLFSLLLALVVSTEGLTKRELLSSVYGYAGRAQSEAGRVAQDRQFERDKEQLRELGIPIETFDSPLEPGNNQLTRYRISKRNLEFPSSLRFDSRELMLLRLAALAWSEGSLSVESRRATMRLAALGAGLDAGSLGIAPNLGTAEPAAAAFQRAIEAGKIVRFDYLLPEREVPLERRVAPLRLHRIDGRWHLIAWDLDRETDRVFLLSRIVGEVFREPASFDPQLRDRVVPAIAELAERAGRERATVFVRRGSVAEARLRPRARGGGGEADASRASGERPSGCRGEGRASDDVVLLDLGMLDAHVLAEELVGYGADTVVVSPKKLRELVERGLRDIVLRHGGGPGAKTGDSRA